VLHLDLTADEETGLRRSAALLQGTISQFGLTNA
jgi:hypothetical protein